MKTIIYITYVDEVDSTNIHYLKLNEEIQKMTKVQVLAFWALW